MAELKLSELIESLDDVNDGDMFAVNAGLSKKLNFGVAFNAALTPSLNAQAAINDLFADFREWDETRAYATNDPVFYLGIPYRAKGATTGNAPATSPAQWEAVGGSASTIGNIFPDPLGNKGNSGWTVSGGSTLATALAGSTGFASELNADFIADGEAYLPITIPAQLYGQEVEFNFEGVWSGLVPSLEFRRADNTTILPSSGAIPSSLNRFQFSSRLFLVDEATVYAVHYTHVTLPTISSF